MFRSAGRIALWLSAAMVFFACTSRTESVVQEVKTETNYDSEDFRITVFFSGCLLGGSSCEGVVAVAFSSENLGYEKPL